MKCEECMDRLVSVKDKDIPRDMKEHMAECEECKAYSNVITELTPKIYPQTPERLKADVLRKANRKMIVTMKNRYSRVAASVVAVVAIAVCITFLGNPTPARAAHRVIDKSLSGMGEIKNMVMKMDIRTDRKENFSFIDIDGEMVEHTLTLQRGEHTKWRLDKGWRCIVFDGAAKYMWSPDNVINVMSRSGAGFEEWFEIFLDPELVLLKEKLALQDGNTEYLVVESGGETVMTANVKAKGDFSNPYLLNTSVEESDTRREIVFDRETGLIKQMKIYVKDSSREVLVLNIKNIEYDVFVDESWLTSVPDNMEWRDVDVEIGAETGSGFANITPKEAARKVFRAFSCTDFDSAKEALIQYSQSSLSESYGGMKLIRLGKPFRSGMYVGVFVPYEIRMPDGRIKKHNLALRNDNPGRVWIVDGGI